MTDYADVYSNKAVKYELMVSKEDYQGNIPGLLKKIRDMTGLDIVDSGAGTGRLACMLAPAVRSVQVFDTSEAMLAVCRDKLAASGLANWKVGNADHRSLPLPDQSVDMVLSGWSVVYTVVWCPEDWREQLGKALGEFKRILRPGGTIIILETMGTGFESPNPPGDLLDYFQYLDESGFEKAWMRTDYRFENREEAHDLAVFFFGEEIMQKVSGESPAILPECTGVWWKKI